MDDTCPFCAPEPCIGHRVVAAEEPGLVTLSARVLGWAARHPLQAAIVVTFLGCAVLDVLDARERARWEREFVRRHRASCTADHCGMCGRP